MPRSPEGIDFISFFGIIRSVRVQYERSSLTRVVSVYPEGATLIVYVNPQHNPLLQGVLDKMSKTPTTLEKVLQDLNGYSYGSELMVQSEDGQERTFQIRELNASMMIQGDRRLKLHVTCDGQHFMCYVHMQDVRSGAARARATLWSPHFERLFLSKTGVLTGSTSN